MCPHSYVLIDLHYIFNFYVNEFREIMMNMGEKLTESQVNEMVRPSFKFGDVTFYDF